MCPSSWLLINKINIICNMHYQSSFGALGRSFMLLPNTRKVRSGHRFLKIRPNIGNHSFPIVASFSLL
jgi:hypothetical protein